MSGTVRCLVTGAAGFVGSHLVEALLARGYEVACLARKTTNLAWLRGSPVRLVYGDIAEAASLAAAVAGVDYVYHAAGITKALHESDYFRVNTAGTANLLRACREAGRPLRRVVLVSSLAALGPPRDDRPLDDRAVPHPLTPYGLSKHLAELLVAGYAGQLPTTVIRPPAIYGPRDREGLTVFRWINRGVRPVTRARHLYSLIHVRDLAVGTVLAAEHPAAIGRTYLLANDEPESLEGLTALVARALGKRAVRVALPRAAIRVAGEVSELAGRIQRRPQIFDRNKAIELTQRHWVCDAARARGEVGFRPSIALPDGIAETVAWYRRAGWLR